MEKVLEFNELLWWVPLGRRMALWGLAMAWIWARAAFILGNVALAGTGILIWSFGAVDNPETNTGGAGIIFIPLLAYLVSLILGLAGAVVGGVAGYYAPMTEPEIPYRSAFFKTMGKRTFWSWFYFSAVSVPVFICVAQWVRFVMPVVSYCALSAALLIVCTGYAATIALRPTGRISVD